MDSLRYPALSCEHLQFHKGDHPYLSKHINVNLMILGKHVHLFPCKVLITGENLPREELFTFSRTLSAHLVRFVHFIGIFCLLHGMLQRVIAVHRVK